MFLPSNHGVPYRAPPQSHLDVRWPNIYFAFFLLEKKTKKKLKRKKKKRKMAEILEKYLSLFIVELGVKFYTVENAYYYLKVDSVEQLYEYYNSQTNHFIVKSENTNPLQTKIEKNDSMHVCVYVEGDKPEQYLVCNPYHLHVGIDHKYQLETEKEKGVIMLSGLEHSIFMNKEIPCYYYLYNEYYEPFITDQKIRDRILIEIVYDLYEDGILTPENEDKVIKLTFNGDKEFINTWKKAKRCKFLSFEKPNSEDKLENGKHFFVVNFNHIEKSKTIISTTFYQNFSSLQNFII